MKRVAGIVVSAGLLFVALAPAPGDAAARKKCVLVELYTSQG